MLPLLRYNWLRVAATLLICMFFVKFMSAYREENLQTTCTAPITGPKVLGSTSLADLPKLVKWGRHEWHPDGMQGVNVQPYKTPPPVPDQRPLRLVATSGNENHYLSGKFDDIIINSGVHRVTAWVKPRSATCVFMQASDRTSGAYGMAIFDLSDGATLKAAGDLKNQGAAAAPRHWYRAWIDIPTGEHSLEVAIGFANANTATVFDGDDELAFLLAGLDLGLTQ